MSADLVSCYTVTIQYTIYKLYVDGPNKKIFNKNTKIRISLKGGTRALEKLNALGPFRFR